MLKRFVAVREDRPGEAWLAGFRAGRKEAERWYRGHDLSEPPCAADCRAALNRHMPELLPHYDLVCALVGDDDVAHRILSHFRPPPLNAGCTQALWLGSEGPALVRNYDYPPDIVSDRFESTSWSGREVICKAQRPWGGCLDGMNERGLVASLTFGGTPAKGPGFSIILMLRYVLETCVDVAEAIAALSRIPVAMTHNVMLLDRAGHHATVFIGPDRTPAVSDALACANHQEVVTRLDLSKTSHEREQAALEALAKPTMTLPTLIERFLQPPLYSQAARSPTVYSAVYYPCLARVDYCWPGKIWTQTLGRFETGDYVHDYGELSA